MTTRYRAGLLSTADATHMLGVSAQVISNWRARGYTTRDEYGQPVRTKLEPAYVDDIGRPYYEWRDLAMAEKATRDRAGRTSWGRAA